MDQVARFEAADRAALFTQTAATLNISPIVVEKDFWVTWTLAHLYALQGVPRLLFKGGTSLSKCYGLIERFSEDLDLGLHRDDLGIAKGDVPTLHKGTKQRSRDLDQIAQRAQDYVRDTLTPKLREEFGSVLSEKFDLKVELSQKESVVMFGYPVALSAGLYGGGRYVGPIVKLEIGARADHYPTRERDVRSLAAEAFPKAFAMTSARVVAQAPERTLLEKALLLHSNARRGKVGERSSRHAYDLLMLLRAGAMDDVTRQLYLEVAEHKGIFGEDRHASEAPTKGICIVGDEEVMRRLQADYRAMDEMFYTRPPAFGEVADALRAIEGRINGLC